MCFSLFTLDVKSFYNNFSLSQYLLRYRYKLDPFSTIAEKVL
jgi:hypothetical protein